MNDAIFEIHIAPLRNQKKYHFSINLNTFSDEQRRVVATIIETNHVIRHLVLCDLVSDTVSDETIAAWAKALRNNMSLKSLILAAPQLSNAHLSTLLQAISENTTIQHFSINVAGLDDIAAGHLAKLIACNTTIKNIAATRNQIGDEGIRAIATALKHNNTLQSLDLENNRCSDEGLSAIASALRINTHLAALDLGHNPITDEAAPILARALSMNTSLRMLKITGEFTEARTQVSLNSKINTWLLQDNFASVRLRNTLLSLLKGKYANTSSLSNAILKKSVTVNCPTLFDIAANKVSTMLTKKEISVTTARTQLPTDVFAPLINNFVHERTNIRNTRLGLFNPLPAVQQPKGCNIKPDDNTLSFKITPS